jgi:hypothetical protein
LEDFLLFVEWTELSAELILILFVAIIVVRDAALPVDMCVVVSDSLFFIGGSKFMLPFDAFVVRTFEDLRLCFLLRRADVPVEVTEDFCVDCFRLNSLKFIHLSLRVFSQEFL